MITKFTILAAALVSAGALASYSGPVKEVLAAKNNIVTALAGAPAQPQVSPIIDPALFVQYPLYTGSGADANGNFDPPTGTFTFDLATMGTYDQARWAVVFHFKSVNIKNGTTVKFTNHPSKAPVVWIVETTVTVAGTIDLSGSHATTNNLLVDDYAEPGPGGFRGGRGAYQTGPGGSVGFGPGGGNHNSTASSNMGTGSYGSGAGYATAGAQTGVSVAPGGATYGSPQIFPLIGGSGGAGYHSGGVNGSGPQGGGGGGALLLSTNGTIAIQKSGKVYANGGDSSNSFSNNFSGAGSGGAVRFVADSISIQKDQTSTAQIHAHGGQGGGYWGGNGRIRFEANAIDLQVDSSPPSSVSNIPGPIFQTNQPEIYLKSVNGVSVTNDPHSGLKQSLADHVIQAGSNAQLQFEAKNVPVGKMVSLRISGANGTILTPAAQALVSTADPSVHTVTFTVNLMNGVSAIQARVQL